MSDVEQAPEPPADDADSTAPRQPGAEDELDRTSRSRDPVLAPADIAPAPGPESPGALVVFAHPRAFLLGKRFELPPRAELSVGRSPDADLSFAEVTQISRRHAHIRREAGIASVEDLDSRNGTYVNGVPVAGRTPLASGDVVQVGPVLLKYFEGAKLEQQFYSAMYERAVRDELTGAFNRLRLEEELARCVAMARRHRRASSLILLDVDDFKRVNDEHGHPYGDRLLQRLVELLAPLLRRESIFARIGGDEFALLGPEIPLAGATVFAERLRGLIAGHVFDRDGARTSVTCSFGIAQLSDETLDPPTVYRLADMALYRAKRAGGNRVEVAGAAAPPLP